MSECKLTSSDSFQEEISEKGQNDQAGKFIRGYSSMVFHRKGKDKRKQGRNNPCTLPINFKENEKKSAIIVAKKCEVLGFEEVSNEFTCASSIMESYNLNTNKEAKFSFRKLDDGTFALETKNSHDLNPENRESGTKRSSKTRHKKERYSHKPLKICFKKRSKALRKSSDSNDDHKSDQKPSVPEEITCVVKKLDECSLQNQTTGKPWATFKSLVTRRRKLHSSLKGHTQLSSCHLEANPTSNCIQRVSKTGRFSNLKIPCMKFSRGKRSTNISLPSEEYLCAASSSEACREQSASDCERSDNALAVKYQLQRSLDGKNGKKSSCLDICSEKSPISKRNMEQKLEISEPKIEPDPNIEQDVAIDVKSVEESKCAAEESKYTLTTCISVTQSQSIQETDGPKLNEDVSHHGNNKNMIEAIVGDNTSSLTDCEDGLDEHTLINIGSLTVDPTSDLYEILLMSTATSLVKKVIQSSIQQLVEEEALLNHVQSKDSERFYL